MKLLFLLGLILLVLTPGMVLAKHHNNSSNSSPSVVPASPSGPQFAPPPCVNYTSTSGPFTDYENLIRSLYHCEHIDINVLNESPNSTIQWYDDKAPPGGVQDKEGELNLHELSHEDNGFMTTVVLVPNP